MSQKTRKRKYLPKENMIPDNKSEVTNVSTANLASFHQIPKIDETWISATQTRMYMLSDPLIDWLNMYGKNKGLKTDTSVALYDPRLDFTRYIMNQGIEFEAYIMQELQTIFADKGSDILIIPSNIDLHTRMQRTLEALKSGVPIISQAVLCNIDNKTYGVADLVVRSDYLNQLVETPVIQKTSTGCWFNSNWHYRVVEIKFTTLKMHANLTTLVNSGSQKAYKAQLHIYNQALSKWQRCLPTKTYILGRGWEGTKSGHIYCSHNPFCRLGVIDYNDKDRDIIQNTDNAILWLRKLHTEGRFWNIYPLPTVPELYPNMSNEMDAPWSSVKKELAEKIEDLTLLWQCGESKRALAWQKGVYKWTDPKCTASIMGINGEKISKRVDAIININRDKVNIVSPQKIGHNLFDWREVYPLEFFIDFENITSVINIKNSSHGNMCYLLGLGYHINKDCSLAKGWRYEYFLVDSLDMKEEERIFHLYVTRINELRNMVCNNINDKVRFVHYTQAENTLLERAFERMTEIGKETLANSFTSRKELCDLYKIIEESPIVIKGAFNFSLKSIVGALSKLGEIEKLDYNGQRINSGTKAILSAHIAEQERIKNNSAFKDHDLIKETVEYNRLDCYSLYLLLTYFRLKH